jgi:intein-encoded DNA endonuclease-like protein
VDLIILGGEKDRKLREVFSLSYKDIMLNAKCSVFLANNPTIDQIYKI